MIVGMDFGTTNSGIAVYDGKKLRLIPLDPANQNPAVARTALYITNDMQITIGRQAIDLYYDQNLNRPVRIERVYVGTITMVFAEIAPLVVDVTVDKDVLSPGRLFLSFKTSLSSVNYVGTVIGSQFYYLEDIIALYLYIAKQRAEQYLQTRLKKVVLGRPVRFSFSPEEDKIAQERLLRAAFRAGYDEVYLQYEPIAAANHYESTLDHPEKVLIFDFGGGTLDISILRLGDPKRREVLATGGLPIAGDRFDQKMTRAKLPQHFGEGTSFRSGDKMLPVPNSFYDAFSNWQELLTLQRPDLLEKLNHIKLTAQKPLHIRRLINLISTSYGLKMYDIVEAVKRDLSSLERSAITLEHPDFYVREPITRSEFARIIRSDIRRVEEHLDSLLQEAGLAYEDIDAVIRTGGSSQIPAFVDILEQRFGAEKVHSIDTFSSVTSGLGIIAHQIETGQIDAEVYRRDDFPTNYTGDTRGAPAVDFDVLKKFVTLAETESDVQAARSLIALNSQQETIASIYQPEILTANDGIVPLEKLGLPPGEYGWIADTMPDEPLVLMTTDYRFMLKTARQIAELNAMGLGLTDAEAFHADEFGKEHVSAVAKWRTIRDNTSVALITTAGYARIFRAETFIPRMEQPVPYSIERLRGDPLALLSIEQKGELVLFSQSGRAARIQAGLLLQSDTRVMRVSPKDRLVAAFYTEARTPIVLATAGGYARRIMNTAIPLDRELNTAGLSVLTRHDLTSAALLTDNQPVRAVTSRRVLPLDAVQLPIESAESRESYRAIRLHNDEILLGLIGPG